MEAGLAAQLAGTAMYGNGEGNTIKHYYDRGSAPKKKKNKNKNKKDKK